MLEKSERENSFDKTIRERGDFESLMSFLREQKQVIKSSKMGMSSKRSSMDHLLIFRQSHHGDGKESPSGALSEDPLFPTLSH